MLDVLSGVSLLGVALALLVHLASFSMTVNSNALHVSLFMGALLLCMGAAFSFPRSQMDIEGTNISLKSSIWPYVPWWLYAPVLALGIYGALGLHVQVPGVVEFSVIDMSPAIARWACVLDATFFQAAAMLYYGAAAMRRAGL